MSVVYDPSPLKGHTSLLPMYAVAALTVMGLHFVANSQVKQE
jgi:hypothetical protein